MARLLRDQDYLRVIKSDNLDQILDDATTQQKKDVEQAAQSEMISYLVQRYKVSEIFSNTVEFDVTAEYFAKQLVEYTAADFDITAIYAVDDRVVFTVGTTDYVYKCLDVTTAGQTPITHPAKWEQITIDKSLYYVTLPADEYDSEADYAVSDEVWFENVVYTCLVANTGIDPTNTAFWSAGATYTITGEYPEDTDFWTPGDNRNQLIVMYLMDITLFHLHARINPRNVPTLRQERYVGRDQKDTACAIGWLKAVASGDITADLPQISPQQGMSIRYGNANDSTTQSNNFLW